MDKFDRKILDSLQRNSAVSRGMLAEQVGLSESQVARRRQALEQSGVIRRYRPDLDGRSLAVAVSAFVDMQLKGDSDGNARRFRDLVRMTPGILEAHAVTGDFDYLMKVCVADLDALRDLVNGVLLMHQTVDRVRSEIVLEILRDDQLLVL